jgi:hypothetical protein
LSKAHLELIRTLPERGVIINDLLVHSFAETHQFKTCAGIWMTLIFELQSLKKALYLRYVVGIVG